MRVCILNGNPSLHNTFFDTQLQKIVQLLEEKKISADLWILRDMNIRQCAGCFNCWVKTTGICSLKDDYIQILKSFIHSDFFIIASPLIIETDAQEVLNEITRV